MKTFLVVTLAAALTAAPAENRHMLQHQPQHTLARKPSGNPPDKYGQWLEPFNAYGSKLLSDDLYVGTSAATAQKMGGGTYTYDKYGNEIEYDGQYVDSIGSDGMYYFGRVHSIIDDNQNLLEEYHTFPDGQMHRTYYSTFKYFDGVEVEHERSEYDGEKEVIYEKTTSEYDSKGRPTRTVVSYGNDEGELYPSTKYEYTYDSSGNYVFNVFLMSDGKWELYAKYNISTNASGGRRSECYILLDDNTWEGYNCVYEELKDNVSTTVNYEYNKETAGWVNSTKIVEQLDSDMDPVTSKTYEWENGVWVLRYETEFFYDSDNRPAGRQDINYMTEPDGTVSANGYKNVKWTDENGVQISETSELVSTVPLKWAAMDKSEKTVQKADGITTETVIYYNWDGQKWQPTSREISQTDASYKQIMYESSAWTGDGWYVINTVVDKSVRRGDCLFPIYHENLNRSTDGYGYGEKTVYTYDEDWNCTSTFRYTYDGQKCDYVVDSFNEKQLDKEGRVIFESEGDRIDGVLTCTRKSNVYDVNGKKKEYDYFRGTGEDYGQIDWTLIERRKEEYDTNGNLIFDESVLFEEYNGEYYLMNGYRTVSSFNEAGDVDVVEDWYYDSESGSFEKMYRTTYTYGTGDLAHVCLTELSEVWQSGTGKWLDSWKSETVVVGNTTTVQLMIYNADGKWELQETDLYIDEGNTRTQEYYCHFGTDRGWGLEYRIVTDIDPVTGKETTTRADADWDLKQLTNSSRQITTHIGDMDVNVTYSWDKEGEKWQLSDSTLIQSYEKDYTSYNTYEECYHWMADSEKWNGMFKWETEYDDDGNVVNYRSYFWDDSVSDWELSNKCVQEHDSNGRLTYLETINDYYGNEYVGSVKWIYKYDRWGNRTLTEEYTWDGTAYVGQNKTEITYAQDGTQLEYADYNWEDGAWYGQSRWASYTDGEGYRFTEYYEWDPTVSDWTGTDKVGYLNEITEFTESDGNICCKWDAARHDWIVVSKYYSFKQWNPSFNINWNEIYTETLTAGGRMNTLYQKNVSNYEAATTVRPVAKAAVSVSVQDGRISVGADDAIVVVRTLSGVVVARGMGPVSADVPSGIYIVTVNGASRKILVP